MNDTNTGMTIREEFGARQVARAPETAVSAAAAQATAAVQARYIVALQRPRNWDMVRSRLLAECRRPSFAEDAEFSLPRRQWNPETRSFENKSITGPTIRFAEAAIRALSNVLPEVQTIYDDDDRRIVRVTVSDLETNVTYSRDITVAKLIEKKDLRKGQKAVGERTNSWGDTVYLVPGTDDEISQREGALVSKTLRTLALRLIPGDLIDEAIALCRKTEQTKDAADPEAARRKLLDSFEEVGVSPSDLVQYIGHDTKNLDPAELKELRGLFKALRDGTTTFGQMMAERAEAREQEQAAKTATKGNEAATGTNGHAAVVKRIADLRLQNAAAYKAACAAGGFSESENWAKAPEDIAASFLAALTKEASK